MTTLNESFEWEVTLEDIGYESGSESLSVPTPLHWEPCPFHVSTQENLSFKPTTPTACPSPGYLNIVCHLTYEEDEESSFNPRMEDHSLDDDILACHLPSIAEEDDDDTEEHFQTVSPDDNVWMEEPVPERHLCIHENWPLMHPWKLTIWSVPLPMPAQFQSLHLTQEDAPQNIDINDIFDFPDVIVTASDEDVPSLEYILRL